jgi:SAM-dependent methyltransferase
MTEARTDPVRLSPAAELGGIDIYLLDQLLRGRIGPETRLFEVGCGGGRNLAHFLRGGYEVSGVDRDPAAIECVRALARELAPRLPTSSFRAEAIEDTTFPAGAADFVISCAVLHFSRTDDEFRSALEASWRILAPGGIFFCRLASTIGLEGRFRSLGSGPERRRFALPDGSERYLVDVELLEKLTGELGGQLIDPIKTTVVQDQRCMTTWVLRRLR